MNRTPVLSRASLGREADAQDIADERRFVQARHVGLDEKPCHG
jgi:hypothetical protein